MKKNIELIEVTTETEQKFKLPDGSVVTLNEYLVWMGNLIYETKKAVA